MGALAVQQGRGRPRSRLYQVAHRIAARFEPQVAQAFLRSVERLAKRIDEAVLRSALVSQSIEQVYAAVGANTLELLLLNAGLTEALERTATTTGQTGASILSDVLGVEVRFNATDPNAILFAREQSNRLIVAVTEDVREAVRIIVASGQAFGLTIDEQAVAIRQLVGLRPAHVTAPLNFARELREGTFRRSRLLHDPTLPPRQRRAMRRRVLGEIDEKLGSGDVSEAWIAEQQARYADNLRSRRALDIARTETLRSSNFGQRENWRQAKRDGHLPETARRMWIVTPDDRLRETHAAVPGMNPDGVLIDSGVYDTPLGPSTGPPLEVNCRCAEGLVFPGLEGVL